MKSHRFLAHVAFLFLLLAGNSIYINAKSHKHRKQGKPSPTGSMSKPKGGSKASPPHGGNGPLDANATSVPKSNTFNVVSYGAKGDGVADDTNVSSCIKCRYVLKVIYVDFV